MKSIKALRVFVCLLASSFAAPLLHGAVVLTNVVSFSSPGTHPSAALLLASDSNFYGTTYYGGVSNAGTFFRLTPGGAIITLASFAVTNGANPYAALIEGPNGVFYGTASAGGTGGNGVVFQFTNNNLVALASFNGTNGSAPQGALVRGGDGNFYGTTSAGGTNGGNGTVFKMTPGSAVSTLFSFNSNNGAAPYSTLVLGPDGTYYGTTSSGGTNGYGTLFQITTNSGFTNLVQFNSTNGANPYCGLVKGTDGNLYGTASTGGSNGYGTVFRIAFTDPLTGPSAGFAFSTLASFNSTNGATPYGAVVQGADGNFYGTTEIGGTNNDGTVFRITPSGAFTSLASLDYFATGNFPMAALTPGSDGNLYSTAHNGGASGRGAIFRLSVPMPPVFLSITPSNSTVTCVWSAVAGQTYQAQSISNINLTNWANLGLPTVATHGSLSASDVLPPGPSQHFYRVILLP